MQTEGIKYCYCTNQINILQHAGEVIIVKEPLSLLIPANKIGVFSCKALCDGVPSCSGYWIINGTYQYVLSGPRMNSTYQVNTSENENTLTLTVNASEAINGTSIQCRYEADGDNNCSDKSATVFLFLILSMQNCIIS